MKPLVTASLVCFIATAVILPTASGLSPLQVGEDLFFDPSLGGATKGLSCNNCHNRGRGLENVTSGPELVSAIKRCLVTKMKGSDAGSFFFMRELPAYVLSLAGKGSGSSGNSAPPDMTNGFRPGGLDAGPVPKKKGLPGRWPDDGK